MAVQSHPMSANPVERWAESIPEQAAFAVSVAAKLAGVALALWYAYDQDTLFPGEHFPRTWTIVVFTSVLALLSCIPGRYPGRAFVAALGAGMLIFGGANLAHRPVGVAVVLCGVIAAVAVAAWNHRRGEPVAATLFGLVAAGALTALAIGAIVQFVDE
ncbi:MAG: hypothetical protein WD557_06725 [Dehalococcoidia bacterium]